MSELLLKLGTELVKFALRRAVADPAKRAEVLRLARRMVVEIGILIAEITPEDTLSQ